MEGWKDGTKNRMQKERETKKRAKGIYKSEPPRRAQKANFLACIFCRAYKATNPKESEQSAPKSGKKNAVSAIVRIL